MVNSVIPGEKGEPLPGGIIVVRLAKLSFGSIENQSAHETHFSLSTDDKSWERRAYNTGDPLGVLICRQAALELDASIMTEHALTQELADDIIISSDKLNGFITQELS